MFACNIGTSHFVGLAGNAAKSGIGTAMFEIYVISIIKNNSNTFLKCLNFTMEISISLMLYLSRLSFSSLCWVGFLFRFIWRQVFIQCLST